ncbi:uncharacterized protein EDB93DRAFT_1278636 [Suillus bovinus]|uniref:uncharacterized protein n=1 Tax=Suillus bovinus TaxID=48563 RepID=UPI001B8841DB|nr:uncharacterized protein EDB93DRAFT_1278636 [Suillus bovinus]KAG2150334.1 hypothetical protein EDB93DRAFT_1278636 [Suillus bovinus]
MVLNIEVYTNSDVLISFRSAWTYNDNHRPSSQWHGEQGIIGIAMGTDPHTTSEKPVAKFYWPEEATCLSEPETLAKVKATYGFNESPASTIRRALGIKDAEQGSRVFCITVFMKLEPITSLSSAKHDGKLSSVIISWEAGESLIHCDISPSNLMIYRTSCSRVTDVLNDYDLSSI